MGPREVQSGVGVQHLPIRARLLGLILPILLVATGCDGEAAPPKGFAVPVVLGPLSRGPAEILVTLDGEVLSPDEAILGAELAAVVESVPARVGQRVSKGDVLVQFDSQPFRIAEAQAKAALQAADAEVAVRTAARDRVQSTTSRMLEVASAGTGAVSKGETEEARLLLAEANAALGVSIAQLALREAALDAARLDVSRTRLRAPLDGVVSRQEARIGQRTILGAPLVAVTANGRLEIVLEAGEAWIGRIQEGAEVRVSLPARPGTEATGVVSGVVPSSSGSGRTQRIRIDLSTPPEGMVPGMAVRGEVTVSALENALQAPRDAVVNGAVFVAEGEKARKVVVSVLDNGRDTLIIEAELTGTEQVVIRGNEALQDGATISVIGPSVPPT